MTDEHLDELLAEYVGRKAAPRAGGGWGKAILSAALSALLTVATGVWWARGVIDDLRRDLELTRNDVHYLREHIDGVEKTAIDAKKSGEEAKLMMFAAKGGYPPGAKP